MWRGARKPDLPAEVAAGEDAGTCSICDARIGMLYMNPRHYCMICASCVCGACSPNCIPMEGRDGLQRVCSNCVSNMALGAPASADEAPQSGQGIVALPVRFVAARF